MEFENVIAPHFPHFLSVASLPASSPIRASEASLARTREGAAKPRGAEERSFLSPSLA